VHVLIHVRAFAFGGFRTWLRGCLQVSVLHVLAQSAALGLQAANAIAERQREDIQAGFYVHLRAVLWEDMCTMSEYCSGCWGHWG
jgi:hypothetical protein